MNRLRLTAAAGVPSGFYLFYVFHYSVNVPYSDDWNLTPLILSAIHGHFDMSLVWQQYGDTRLFVPNLFFMLHGIVDRWNIRVVLVSSALLFVATYLLLLQLFRAYLGRRLTFWPVFLLGIVWFSLEDVQNSLWSFQLAWYLATFFLVAMISSLLVVRSRRPMLGFVLAVVASVVGSYSIVQGFVLWPVGLLCLLWCGGWTRRTWTEAAAWIASAAITAVVFVHGFRGGNSQCTTTNCSGHYALAHPQLLVRYVVLLIGNVVPGPYYSPRPDLVVHEVLGVAVLAVAIFVVVQSIRERSANVSPLPVLLIAYAIAFDALIAIGRFGAGPAGALNNNRYTMPNLILLTGIVIYVCRHAPQLGSRARPIEWRGRLSILGFAACCLFVLVQCAVTTRFGIVNGRASHQVRETDVRVVVNLDRIPVDRQACFAALVVIPPETPTQAVYFLDLYGNAIERERLSSFQRQTRKEYRAKGPPSDAALLTAAQTAAVAGRWGPACP